VEINNLHIDLIRKPIRRLHLRIYPDGKVVVSAPWLMPQRLIQDFVLSKWSWIVTTRERLQQNPPVQRSLPKVSRTQAEELIQYLTENVEKWRLKMGEAPVTWTIRNMRSQWGNCRAQSRRLTFNLQLALVPNCLRDYIIVHELSHLKVQNHGPLFKAREAEFMPDWKERRKQLKEYLNKLYTNYGS